MCSGSPAWRRSAAFGTVVLRPMRTVFIEVGPTLQSTSHPGCLRRRRRGGHARCAAAEIRRVRGASRPHVGWEPAPSRARQAAAALSSTTSGARPHRHVRRPRRGVPGWLARIGAVGVDVEGLDRPPLHAPLPGTSGDGGARSETGSRVGRGCPGRNALRRLWGQAWRGHSGARAAATTATRIPRRGPGHRRRRGLGQARFAHPRHELRQLPRDGGRSLPLRPHRRAPRPERSLRHERGAGARPGPGHRARDGRRHDGGGISTR